MWVLLAAFVNPEKLLPFGTAVAAFFSIILYQYRRIAAIREEVEKTVTVLFNQRLRDAIQAAVKLRLGAQAAHDRLLAAATGEQYVFDPNDLFDLIDCGRVHATDREQQRQQQQQQQHQSSSDSVAGDGKLSRAEFDRLFDRLGINMSPTKRDMLFAYCAGDDINGAEAITREEFCSGWDYLVQELRMSVLRGDLGLSDLQVALYVASLALTLLLLFSFLLTSVSAFYPRGGLGALIQSALIFVASTVSAQASETYGAAASASWLRGRDGAALEGLVSVQLDHRIRRIAA